jgi:hypothetical protein
LRQDGNGYIDRRELGLMMRFLGEPVTQEEIDVSAILYILIILFTICQHRNHISFKDG